MSGLRLTVFDRDMDLLSFLYPTDFQLSGSSGNGQCGGKVNPSASFYFSRDASKCSELRLEMVVKSLFPLLFISSDVVSFDARRCDACQAAQHSLLPDHNG
ncbi:hypothetical protein CHARACLAT_032873 [Characodon lateralis]|uniref:Uncharacterized protein n=1 Tax=Characodon lateralis TaxID=208331 RepID=A0ABU7FAH4_9TELE|nr:hypothetical protein [Characodon lateralis]